MGHVSNNQNSSMVEPSYGLTHGVAWYIAPGVGSVSSRCGSHVLFSHREEIAQL